jgi:hypothetical protein
MRAESGDAPWAARTVAEAAAWLAATDAGGDVDHANVERLFARAHVEAAFGLPDLPATLARIERWARTDDNELALACVAAIRLDALYCDWRPLRDSGRWVELMRPLSVPRLAALPIAPRLALAIGILAADLYGDSLAAAAGIAEAVPAWCDEIDDAMVPLAANALGYALEFRSGERNWPRARDVLDRCDALGARLDRLPLVRTRLETRRAFYFDYRRGDYANALTRSQRAVADALAIGVPFTAREARITVSLAHLMRGEIEAAGRAIDDEAAHIPEGHLMLRANVHYERAWLHALRRDVIAAQRELDLACTLFAEVDEHGVMANATPSLQSQLFVLLADLEHAAAVFERRLRSPDAWRVDAGLIAALRALRQSDPEVATRALAEVLPLARRLDFKGIWWACRAELKRLLEFAIAAGIEPAWARQVIEARVL